MRDTGPREAPAASAGRGRKPARLSHEGRVVLLAILCGLPGSATAVAVLWAGDFSSQTKWTLTILIVGA